MALKKTEQIKEIIKKQHNISDDVIDNMFKRGFFPHQTDDEGNYVYDDYFANGKVFNDIFNQYNDTISYYTSGELYQYLVSHGITEISVGAIEKMMRENYIESYKVNDTYLFNPKLAADIDFIKNSFEEMEEKEAAKEAEDELLFEEDMSFGESIEAIEDNEKQDENDINEFFFEEEEQKEKKKKTRKSPINTSALTDKDSIAYSNKNNYNTGSETLPLSKTESVSNDGIQVQQKENPRSESEFPYKEKQAGSEKSAVSLAEKASSQSQPSAYEKYCDDEFKRYNTEVEERRKEQQYYEDEKKTDSSGKQYKIEEFAKHTETQSHSVNDNGKNLYSFTGHENDGGFVERYISEDPYFESNGFAQSKTETVSEEKHRSQYKPNNFITKVQIAEVATSNVLSQNGINEIIEYARTYKQEVQLPAKDGSYFKIEPIRAPTTEAETKTQANSSAPPKSDYRISVIRPNADASKNESEVLYSSVVSEDKSNFASVSAIYAESMGVKALESGYQDSKQEAIDSKILYAIGVVPQSQTFAQPKNGDSQKQDYTAIQLPETVEFVHPSIVSKFDDAGIKSFYKGDKHIDINDFNKTNVNENSIVASAYLGSEEYIGRELSKVDLKSAISNSVSAEEYKRFVEKVQVSAITNDTVLSQEAITHIVDVVRSEKHKVDIPLRNGQLLTFEPEKASENLNDFKVLIYSPDDGDYSKPKETLLYSSSSKETQAVNFGDVYTAYANGMEVETLQSFSKSFSDKQNDKKVLYAIGAITQKEIADITDKNGIVNVPKGVDYVNANVIRKIENAGANKINVDNRTFSLREYENRSIETNRNNINESVYLGDYSNIERITRKSEVSDSFVEQFNIKQKDYINGRPVSQKSVGTIRDANNELSRSSRHAAASAVIASSISTAVKTATLQRSLVGNESELKNRQEYIDDLTKNSILTEDGFNAIIRTVNSDNRKIEIALNNGSVMTFSPSKTEAGRKTVGISLSSKEDKNVSALSKRTLTADAVSNNESAYSEYLKTFGIENAEHTMRDIPEDMLKNESRLLFALGALSDDKIQMAIENGVAKLPERVSYLHPNLVEKFERAGAQNLRFGNAAPVNIKTYINAGQKNRAATQSVDASSVILTLRKQKPYTNSSENAVIIPKDKGYILSYTDKGSRVNLTMLGTLRNDSRGYLSPNSFGIERQIGAANSRVISAYPNIQTVIQNGKIQVKINPELIQQRHQLNTLTRVNKEIVRLSNLRTQKKPSEILEKLSSIHDFRAVPLQIADNITTRNKDLFKMLQDKSSEPQIRLMSIYEFTKGRNKKSVKAEAEYGNGSPILDRGIREINKNKAEKDLKAKKLRSVVKQLGKMSGLMQSVDYFTTGVNYVFGYSAPINIIGSLAEHSSAKREIFAHNELLSSSLLIDDLSTFVPENFGAIKRDISSLNTNQLSDTQKNKAIRLHARKLNREIAIRSKTLFGQDITRFTTYKMKTILSEGKFNGKELSNEQREQLLIALKIKGYSIGNLSVFNIKDNLQRRGINLSKNYNVSKSSDIRSLLKELDTISFSVMNRIFNGNRLSDLNDKQLSSLANLDDDAIINIAHGMGLKIDENRLSLIRNSSVTSLKNRINEINKKLKNATGKEAENLKETLRNLQTALRVKTKADEVQAISSAYLSGKKSLELKRKEVSEKRNARSRLSILARRAFSNTYMMAGANVILMPIEYMRMAKFYTQFTVTLTKSVMGTVKRMYKSTLQKLWHKTPMGKLTKKLGHKLTTHKAERKNKRIQKKTERAQSKIAKKTTKAAKLNERRTKYLDKHPKINKVSNRINKVRDKGRNIRSHFTDAKNRLGNIKNKVLNSKPVKFVTKPFTLYNKLKKKILTMSFSVLKYVVIVIAILALFDSFFAITEMVMGSVLSIVWNASDADENDYLDDPIATLTKDRVEFCIGMDSALKVYVEAMIDKDNYNWDSFTGKTPVDYILDSEEVENEKEDWFDPKKNKYTNINKLGLEINGIQTGIHYSYYDGDGNEVGLQSNAKDIMSVASTWMYEDYKAKGLFKSYIEKLWNYSHAVAYMPRKYEDKYIYECDLDDESNPCHENKYEYKCNDKGANIYEKDESGNYITKKLHSNPVPENYSEHGCQQHTVTYCGGSPNVGFTEPPCSNYDTVMAPDVSNANSQKIYYCKGHSDCDSKCKNESGIQVSYKTYHTAGTSVLRAEGTLGYVNNSSAICNNTAGVRCSNCSTSEEYRVYVADCGGCKTTYHSYYCGYGEYDEKGTTWYCYGHKEGVCNNYHREIANQWEYLIGTQPPIYKYVCNGHHVDRYVCNGHRQTVDKITCNGYCPGHELTYCTGHVDIDVSIVTLFLDDTNGLTKLGVPKSVSFGTETITEKDKLTLEEYSYGVDIEIPKTPFTSLYENVTQFQNIKRNDEDGGTSLFPLPDSYHLKEVLRLKLSEIDNVAVGANETIDTLRFLYYYTNGKYPYDSERAPKSLEAQIADYDSIGSPPADVEVNFANLDEFVGSYFTKFATCWWQDLNDQGSFDGKLGQTVNIQHYAGEYQKFGKYNYFDGFYLYDDSGNIKTATITNEDGSSEKIYLDKGNVERAEVMYSDDWKDLYDIDFPGSFKGTLKKEDITLLTNTAKAYHGDAAADRARTILNTIGISEYPTNPDSCVKYAQAMYQGFGTTVNPFTSAINTAAANSSPDKAVNYLYSGNKTHLITNEEEVENLITGDAVLIGGEVHIVLYNTSKDEGTQKGEIVFATVAGGGTPRLVAFRTEMLTTGLTFGYIKFNECK